MIIYWEGFDTVWKLACAMLAGLALFALGAWRSGTNLRRTMRNAIWIAPWLTGHVIIGALGRYGSGARNILPNWIDLAMSSPLPSSSSTGPSA